MHLSKREKFVHKRNMLLRMDKRVIEKPWGRTDLGDAFGVSNGRRIGEIWFMTPGNDAALPMVKFLFTSERLSIQVHPGGAAAATLGLPSGKDECWLILAAEEDARIGIGLKESADLDTLRAAALDGSIVDLVDWRPVKANDFYYIPAGTIHAIGEGVTLVEVQQNIDCTFRLFDYGRPRELHLDEGLSVACTRPSGDMRSFSVDPAQSETLVSGPHFHLVHLAGPMKAGDALHANERLTLIPLSEGCRVAGCDLARGEGVMVEDAGLITIDEGGRALLCWPA